jgi:3-oxoacyl-[acyl-carrier protein] reductase
MTPFHATTSAEEQQMITGNIPLGRFADPRELALPIVFLLSDAASFITGEIMDVNGGVLMDTV